MSAEHITIVRALDEDTDDDDKDLFDDAPIVPDVPLTPGSPLSDPFAKADSSAAKVYVLGAYERRVLKERWDGSRETARAIGEDLGGIPTYQIVTWARELHLPVRQQPHQSANDGENTLSGTQIANLREAYGIQVPAETSVPNAAQRPGTGRGKRISQETRAQIITLREQGISQRSVAQRLGISESTVYYVYANRKEATPRDFATQEATKDTKDTPPAGLGSARTRPTAEARPAPVMERMRSAVTHETHGTHEANYAALLDLLEFLPPDGYWTSERQRDRWQRAFLATLEVITDVATRQDLGAQP